MSAGYPTFNRTKAQKYPQTGDQSSIPLSPNQPAATFNPKTEQFTAYTLPEPFAMDRESRIDNSTDPVSVWFVDHDGWLIHIQPLD